MRPSAADVDFDGARSARNGERDGKGNYFLWLSTALHRLPLNTPARVPDRRRARFANTVAASNCFLTTRVRQRQLNSTEMCSVCQCFKRRASRKSRSVRARNDHLTEMHRVGEKFGKKEEDKRHRALRRVPRK